MHFTSNFGLEIEYLCDFFFSFPVECETLTVGCVVTLRR